MPDLPGGGLQALGQGIAKLGAGLSQLGGRQQADDTLIRAEELSQVIAAKELTYSIVNSFNSRLHPRAENAIPGAEMLKTWAEMRPEILEEVNKVLKFPSAKAKWGDWAVDYLSKQEQHVRTSAQNRWEEETVTRVSTALQDQARLGNEDEVTSLISDGTGVYWDEGGARSLADKWIPEARYNAARADMFAMDPDVALDLSRRNGFGSDWGLDAEHTEKLQADIQQRRNLDGVAAWQEFEDLTLQVTDPVELMGMRDQLNEYLLRVDDGHQAEVKTFLNALDTQIAKGKEAQQKLDQSTVYSRHSTAIGSWNGEDEPPWNPEDLDEMVAQQVVTEQQADKLRADYAKIEKEVMEGVRTPDRISQRRNTSALGTTMYQALDKLEDPRVAVPVSKITQALDYGRISLDQHDDLLAKRETLGKDYEAKLKAAKEAKGPLLDDPEKIADLWGIILDETLDTTTKLGKARPFRFNGVSGPTWNTIIGHMDAFNSNPMMKSTMDNLNSVYQAIINDPLQDPAKKKGTILEKAAAANQMMRIFQQFPDDPGKWDEALQSILNPLSKKQLNSLLISRLGAGFGGLAAAPEWMTLETARETLPEEYKTRPGFQMQHAIAGKEIEENEKRVLERSGRTIVDQYTMPTGERVYSTVPIPRDEFGNPMLRATETQGNLFVVRSIKDNRGRITQKIVPVGTK